MTKNLLVFVIVATVSATTVQAAETTSAREGNKAPDRSRIFTDLERATEIGWTNRAQLAAIALMRGNTSAPEGRAVVLVVGDDPSGVDVPSTEDIQRQSLPPWVNAKPIQLNQVLPTFLAMPQATPMDRQSMQPVRIRGLAHSCV
jgi:hypothetical protein